MFGYVTIRKDDLKVKDYNKYQAYYCGLCQDIKEAYGKKGQAMLTFDMTFLSILLTGLYECETKEEEPNTARMAAKMPKNRNGR